MESHVPDSHPPIPSLSALASRLSTAASTIDTYLTSSNRPSLSFSPHEPFPEDIKDSALHIARESIIRDARLLHDLVAGSHYHWNLHPYHAIHDTSAILVIEHFELWRYVPLAQARIDDEPTASYEEIAAASGLDIHRVRGCLRHAMTMRIFREPCPGRVAHTSRSAAWVRDEDGTFRKWVRFMYIDSARAAGGLPEAMKRFGNYGGTMGRANQAATNVAYNLMDVDSINILAEREGNAVNFEGAMKFLSGPGPSHDDLLVGWEGLDKEISKGKRDLKIVDVGGGNGHFSIALAKRFPEFTFVVQDRSTEQLPTGTLPESVAHRVELQEHNFFDPQPVQADIYVLRYILHDWSTPDGVKILQALIPALRPGAKVLLVDGVLSDDDVNKDTLSLIHNGLNMQMITVLNSHERTLADWKELLRLADHRFELTRVVRPPRTILSVVEVTWRPECGHGNGIDTVIPNGVRGGASAMTECAPEGSIGNLETRHVPDHSDVVCAVM